MECSFIHGNTKTDFQRNFIQKTEIHSVFPFHLNCVLDTSWSQQQPIRVQDKQKRWRSRSSLSEAFCLFVCLFSLWAITNMLGCPTASCQTQLFFQFPKATLTRVTPQPSLDFPHCQEHLGTSSCEPVSADDIIVCQHLDQPARAW